MILLAELPAESRPAPAPSTASEPAPPSGASAPVPAPAAVAVDPSSEPEPNPEPDPDEPPATLSAYDREVLLRNSEPPPTPLARWGLSARVALGASYQVLYTVPITSGELELGFGGRAGKQAVYMTVDVERGRTELGLHTQGWHVGIISEWSLGRFRYGFQVRAGAMFIDRITVRSEDLASASFGFRGHVAWDFVHFDNGDAFVAELGLRTDYYSPIVYGPSVLLGYRWDANHRLGDAH